MIPYENSSVQGVVWRGLTVEDFTVLDGYEGCHVQNPVYQREKRKVIIEGTVEEVWTYLATSTFLTSIGKESDGSDID